MKFREHEGLMPKIVASDTARGLEKQLESLGDKYDFVDLQYSDNGSQYSALALLKKKED